MKYLSSAIVFFLAIIPAALAQEVTYTTNFNNFPTDESLSTYTPTDPYTNGSPPAWITTDNNQDDGVLPNGGGPGPGKWGIMGGGEGIYYGPPQTIDGAVQNESELWYPVSIPSSTIFQFSMDFDITSSEASGAYSANDTFGVTFRSASDALLFQILFSPDSSEPASEVDAEWNDGGSNTSGNVVIARNAIYAINVTGNLDAGTFMSVVSAPSNPSSSGTFFGSFSDTGQTLGEAGITWLLQTSGTFGSNSIAFTNYSVVPEPSVGVILLLGGLGLVIWQSRKRFV